MSVGLLFESAVQFQSVFVIEWMCSMRDAMYSIGRGVLSCASGERDGRDGSYVGLFVQEERDVLCRRVCESYHSGLLPYDVRKVCVSYWYVWWGGTTPD